MRGNRGVLPCAHTTSGARNPGLNAPEPWRGLAVAVSTTQNGLPCYLALHRSRRVYVLRRSPDGVDARITSVQGRTRLSLSPDDAFINIFALPGDAPDSNPLEPSRNPSFKARSASSVGIRNNATRADASTYVRIIRDEFRLFTSTS